MAKTSTALSDFILAASSFYAAYMARHINPKMPTYGMILFGGAATLGVYRFGAAVPDRNIVNAHKLASWLGNIIGVPFLAGGLMRYNGHGQAGIVASVGSVAFLGIYKVLSRELKNKGNTAVPTLSVMGMIISSAMTNNYYGCYTGLGIVLAGMLIGTEGYAMNIPKIDLFHYALAANNMVYLYALGIRPW